MSGSRGKTTRNNEPFSIEDGGHRQVQRLRHAHRQTSNLGAPFLPPPGLRGIIHSLWKNKWFKWYSRFDC